MSPLPPDAKAPIVRNVRSYVGEMSLLRQCPAHIKGAYKVGSSMPPFALNEG